MDVKVTIKLKNEKLKKIENAFLKAGEETAEQVKSDIIASAVVPKDTGELERSGFVKVIADMGIFAIVFDTPYARRLYWHPEYNFRKDKNANACGKWMAFYLPGGNKEYFVIENQEKNFIKNAGSLVRANGT